MILILFIRFLCFPSNNLKFQIMVNLQLSLVWLSLFIMNCVCLYWICRCFNLLADIVNGLATMTDILKLIADLVSTHDSNS